MEELVKEQGENRALMGEWDEPDASVRMFFKIQSCY